MTVTRPDHLAWRREALAMGERRRAQALVEFCLILPVLLVILATVIDFGYLLFVHISVHASVREGAILAMHETGYTSDQIRDRVLGTSGALLKPGEVVVSQSESLTIAGKTYRAYGITVDHTHHFLVFPGPLNLGSTIQVRSTVRSLVVTGLVP